MCQIQDGGHILTPSPKTGGSNFIPNTFMALGPSMLGF